VANEEGFRQALLAAEEVAREGYLVTLGIRPNRPEIGYGYVQRSSELGQFNNHTVYQVEQFLEKPDLATAEKFVASGEYYWNSGMFIWQLSTLYDSFSEYMPEFYSQLNQMEQAIAAGQAVDAIWQDIQSESIDVGIMERAEKVAVIPVDFGWNDVGSWAAIHEINQPDENNNVILEAEHFGIDTTNTLIDGGNRLVATIGLDNVVIVDTDDALLVCAKDKVQDIKQIVNWLKEKQRTDLQ
jgi:mannose-1-phosphate guanylyltransferase